MPASPSPPRPTLAVWKFASCDGCQLSLLDLEPELLALAEVVQIANFKEASSTEIPGPYDLSLVEGSITTARDAERIRAIRRESRHLVTIGACATSGGIQALRNFADTAAWVSLVYATPGYIETLATSTAIADHVPVDFELRGCPVNKHQLLEVINALLNARRPVTPGHSVCLECKLAGHVCVMVTGTPCLGPVTHAGCGALCPGYARGCFGCYGPAEAPNVGALTLALHARGVPDRDLARLLHTFNVNAPAFRDAGLLHLEAAAHGSSSEDTSRERTAPDGTTLTDARRAASHDTPGTGTP